MSADPKPKAVISNRIYFRPRSPEHKERIVKELTYRIAVKGVPGVKFGNMPVEVIRGYKFHPGGLISVPQGRQDLIGPEYEVVDKRVTYPAPFPTPRFPLRDSQQPVYDAVEDTCFINALVGWGKTFTALYLARKLGQRTLVVTHTTALRDQWIEEVKNLYDMDVGVIGSGKFDIEDHAIVVANIQSATKVIAQINKEFGTVILDEAHHVPATTFTALIDGMHARYRIGLSGTVQRTDGKHVLFRDMFGDVIHKPPQAHTLDPTIKVLKTSISLPKDQTYVQKINTLLYDQEYQQFIAAIAKTQIKRGHKVLIAGDRVEFLEQVSSLIGTDCVLITGSKTGTKYEERKALIEKVESGEASCIAASKKIFTEGISVNVLSCLILVEPFDNRITLEQLIGRIQRLHENKPAPVVIDLHYASASEKRKDAARLAFYAEKGWKVEVYD